MLLEKSTRSQIAPASRPSRSRSPPPYANRSSQDEEVVNGLRSRLRARHKKMPLREANSKTQQPKRTRPRKSSPLEPLRTSSTVQLQMESEPHQEQQPSRPISANRKRKWSRCNPTFPLAVAVDTPPSSSSSSAASPPLGHDDCAGSQDLGQPSGSYSIRLTEARNSFPSAPSSQRAASPVVETPQRNPAAAPSQRALLAALSEQRNGLEQTRSTLAGTLRKLQRAEMTLRRKMIERARQVSGCADRDAVRETSILFSVSHPLAVGGEADKLGLVRREEDGWVDMIDRFQQDEGLLTPPSQIGKRKGGNSSTVTSTGGPIGSASTSHSNRATTACLRGEMKRRDFQFGEEPERDSATGAFEEGQDLLGLVRSSTSFLSPRRDSFTWPGLVDDDDLFPGPASFLLARALTEEGYDDFADLDDDGAEDFVFDDDDL
ncbi:hypothetical protein DFJ73DRAFT_868300, partial [Zopfochytrium polystomum]